MELYVWTEFEPDYTGGIAFAIAHTEEEARQLIAKKTDYKIMDWGNLEIHNLENTVAYLIRGGS